MDTIMVVVGRSDEHAATIATDLAAALGARLVAVSVADGARADVEAVRVVHRHVQAIGRQVGIRVDVRTLHGPDRGEVLRQAARERADVVVVGQHPEVEELVRSSPVPVLVVPRADG
jgi:nucleotide-binding universal stress UspA family protein